MASLNKTISREAAGRWLDDFAIIGTLLQRPTEFFDEVRNGTELPAKILTLLISAIFFLVVYGAIIGSGHPLQAISAALKFPLVFLSGLIACTPALYILDVLLGSRRGLSQTVAVLLAAITVVAVLLFSFAPITIVFRLTANGYQFFKLLNVSFLLIAMLVGLVYLERGLQQTSAAEANRTWRRLLYSCWVVLFLFVVGQMAWSLRPFFHYPGAPFTLLAGSGNIFTELRAAFGEFLGFWIVR